MFPNWKSTLYELNIHGEDVRLIGTSIDRAINGKNKHLGFYDTPELAHEAWIVAKKKYVSECANEAYAKGEISERVRDALLNRKFE